MIAQARITSETTATVHLADESVEVSGADLPEIRDRVKQVLITSAKSADEELDVVIVEPDVRHHLRVEPSGRISPREADDRPLFGPGADEPLIAPPLMVTGEQPAVDAEGAPAARPHRARRRRAAAKPPSTVPGSAGGSAESTGEHAAVTTGEHARISPFAPEAGDVPVAGVAPSAAASSASAPSAVASASSSAASAASASSAASAPSARSARSAPSAPSAVSAPSAPSAAPAPSSPGVSAPAPSAASSAAAAKRPLPSRATVLVDGRPTLQDLQSSTAKHRKVKATRGFRGVITRATRGVISPG